MKLESIENVQEACPYDQDAGHGPDNDLDAGAAWCWICECPAGGGAGRTAAGGRIICSERQWEPVIFIAAVPCWADR